MKTSNHSYELNLLVKNRPITEYEHEGNIFVEGRKGSEFEVEFKNKTSKRVLVVPSVDGKSVLDGQPATPDSKGYIVGPWGSIRIPGWTLDDSNVAKFTFEDKEKSYAVQMADDATQVQSGVIGVMVYSEVEKPKPVEHIHHYYPPVTYPPSNPWKPWSPWVPRYPDPFWCGSSINQLDSVPLSTSDTKSMMRGTSMNATTQSSASLNAQGNVVSNAPPIENAFEMGAGFGEKADFKTRESEFKRDKVVATMLLYYDSRRNLEKRGIEVVKREIHATALPQAFSGVGCTPPPGWQG